ncbi:MAG: PAS domain-containing protein [Hyphomicrobiaceae bacterium]|nr:PAS domain-containing protein [Hyphomicrobiaceae bacterium]
MADRSDAVPVIGIGASAGGIEALKGFFHSMPGDSGGAIVVVLHLDPTHESKMAELLAGFTSMPVAQVEDGMRIEANHVYVIAPNNYLRVRDNALHLSEPKQPRGQRYPVDEFFKSLASQLGARAIAIVLSGTGTNGTEGLKEVRAQGGLILVQAPDTAKFDGMPRSAISAGLADHVLAPEQMPERILAFLHHGYVAVPDKVEGGSHQGAATLDNVLDIVHARSGSDFRSYKRSTIGRRVHRRLGLRSIGTLGGYIEELRANPDEVAALVDDMMISVTGFFRDADAWKALADKAIDPLIAEAGASLRIWVPGCATGEEAYSMAMLATTRAEAAGKQLDLRIFATDSREDNLRRAREGVYPAASMADIPPELRRRFFREQEESCQVIPELRDTVMFARQNLLTDPPFSRMDLVSCRNLLIYLEPAAQQRVLALCHFGLREGGYLFLGNAETVGRNAELFEPVSKKWRIYRRLGPTRHDIVNFPVLRGPAQATGAQEAPPTAPAPPVAAAEMARRALLERYAPTSVLIDDQSRVLYFHGETGDYLKQPTGEPTRDLISMARDGLGLKMRAAIREAAQSHRPVKINARIRRGETNADIVADIVPLPASSQFGDCMLVSFEPAPAATPAVKDHLTSPEPSSDERALQEELKAARDELHSTIEQMETANEELKASNEEVTSMNEELQSANEELETSKEELQSFNEELNTVNSQLQHKNKELEDLTNDLSNLLSGTQIASLFLDTSFRIKWFSPATGDLFDLATTDIGRPIIHFARKFADEDLLPDAEKVLKKLVSTEAEVRSTAGRWYLRRALPYRTLDNRIDGVVVTFTDITERKQAADAVDEARIYAEATVETTRQPLLVLDGDLRVQSANQAFYREFRVGEQETAGRLLYDMGNGQWDIPRLRRLLDETLSQDHAFSDVEVEHDFRDLGKRCMLLNGRKLVRGGGREELILLAIDDVTERKAAAARQQVLIAELNHRVKNMLTTVQAVAAQTLGTASSMEDARKAFGSRLIALSRAHDILMRENWAGADLARIVEDVVEPHAGGQNRFRIDGPSVRLNPGPALSFAMALHELCTNASKYGALSTANGQVDIGWQVEDKGGKRRLQMRWEESGGPPVAPPKRKGFGSRLIERALATELGGKVSVGYEPAGVVCTIDAPLPAEEEAAGLRGDRRES